MISQLDSGCLDQNQTLVPPGPPMTSVSTCLLFMTRRKVKGHETRGRFHSPCPRACESFLARREALRGPGNTLENVSGRDAERWSDGAERGKSVILMGTFTAWES